MPLNFEAIDTNHAIGRTEQVLVCLWRHETTLEAVRELEPIVRSLSGGGILTVVEEGASLPGSDVRAELAQSMKSAPVVCSALVFEGDGFRAAAVRAISTTIYQLARPPFPVRVFADVREAAQWMESLDENIHADEVVAVVEELRSALVKQDGLPS